MYNIEDVANWFLNNMDNITNKKLQKMVYYAYSWYLAFNNNDSEHIENRFFANNFEAWIHGAVDPHLYTKYKKYGSQYIPKYTGTLPAFTYDEIDLLNQIVIVYGIYNGNELESICHQEKPWINARKDCAPGEASHNKIDDRDIFKCYASRL